MTNRRLTGFSLVIGLIFAADAAAEQGRPDSRPLRRETIADGVAVRPETPAQAKARHGRVAERRKRVFVICHRGALEFAHENTLEAFRATMELGADGNEIDIRATRDGALVCFHDDMLDATLDAYGDVADYDWDELRTFRFRRPGPFGRHCRIPTLREVLDLHHRHGGLLHLDLKRPSWDKAIARLLTELDMWDHVIAANANCQAIISDSRFRPLTYKASLYLGRTEVDAAVIGAKMKRSGNGFIVEDPRGLLVALGREIGRPSTRSVAPQPSVKHPVSGESKLTDRRLLEVLDDDADWNRAAETEEAQAESAKWITARARAADEISRRGEASREVLDALARRVRQRSLHRHWRYHGLDGCAALRALFRLDSSKAIELARFALWRDDKALEAIRNPKYDTPSSWVDFRVKMFLFRELESLPGEATEALCRDYLALEESAALALGPLQFGAAAKTLLTISPRKATALVLLDHARSEVRGRAILFCVARGHEPWAREALAEQSPDALAYVLPKRGDVKQ